MYVYNNLIILGTSHISIQSVKQVEKVIKKHKPGIIALELDKRRFQAIQSKSHKLSFKDIKFLGIKGFILNLLGAWAEKKLGKIVNTSPGSEMKKAIELAKENKLKIALIDQEIQITIKKLIKNIPAKEKLRFIKDLFFSPIKKKDIGFDLKNVPDQSTIIKLMKQVKKRYPAVYYILVEERNKIMAKNLNRLILQYPEEKVFAIVGAGHEKGIIGELKLIKN